MSERNYRREAASRAADRLTEALKTLSDHCVLTAYPAGELRLLAIEIEYLRADVRALAGVLRRVKTWSNEYDFMGIQLVLAVNTSLARPGVKMLEEPQCQ